jgi:hypothetical protein
MPSGTGLNCNQKSQHPSKIFGDKSASVAKHLLADEAGLMAYTEIKEKTE